MTPETPPDTPTESADDGLEYRELSTAAVASLVLGLASPVVLLGGVLVVLPLVAVALGMAALGWIAGDPGGRSGRGLALAGASLGVAALAMSGANAVVTPWLLRQQAEDFAEVWLEDVRAGNLEAAAARSVLPAAKPTEEEPPSFTEAWPVVGRMAALEGWSAVRLEETLACVPLSKGRWQVDQRYALLGADAPPREVLIRLLRNPANSLRAASWLVTDIQAPTDTP